MQFIFVCVHLWLINIFNFFVSLPWWILIFCFLLVWTVYFHLTNFMIHIFFIFFQVQFLPATLSILPVFIHFILHVSRQLTKCFEKVHIYIQIHLSCKLNLDFFQIMKFFICYFFINLVIDDKIPLLIDHL